MGKKLEPFELEFYKKIDKILYLEWDPIGISNLDFNAEDEYRAYLPFIFKLALENTDSKLLVDYLTKVRTKTMGLYNNYSHDLQIAEKILHIKKDIGL